MGILCFAHNEKRGKNGHKLFCLSTKTPKKWAKTILPIGYKNGVSINISKKIVIFEAILADF